MNNKRTGKFYRKNEAEVMKSLGLVPTKNSGSGWIEKEDGQNDYVICQLKSTDAQSIKVNQKDIHILEYNASVTKKLPMFAIQFLNTDEVWLMVKPSDISEIAKYIDTGECNVQQGIFHDILPNITPDVTPHTTNQKKRKVICSGSSERERMRKEREKKYGKKSKSAI